jgi:hypothetical protein
MSYLRCDNCGWEQDDFWSEDGWSPFCESTIKNLKAIACMGLRGEKIQLDADFSEGLEIEHEIIDGVAYVDFKDQLIWELDLIKRNILNMTWYTEDEFRGDPNPVCPQCGSSEDFDID